MKYLVAILFFTGLQRKCKYNTILDKLLWLKESNQ